MIFGGREHEQVARDEGAPGDFFYYLDEGRRLGRIARVDTCRGSLVYVTKAVEASAARVAQRARRVPVAMVVSVWRRTRGRRARIEGGERENRPT